METHNFAEIFPLMNKKEFKELKEDIKQNGLFDPIVLHEGKILDGRNRYNACEELKIKPKTTKFEGDDALTYVMSTNLKRRHLTDSQKAVVGRRYKIYYAKFAKERMLKGTLSNQFDRGTATDKAGEVAGVSGRYIDMADEVIEKKPEMEEKIMSGKVKVKTAYREIKLEEQKKEIEKVKKVTGEYDVIVIDPPWSYGDAYDEEMNRGTTPYPTMSLNEIRNIKLPSKKDCILWLWTTNTFIEEALELVDVWGFEKKSIVTWDKKIMGMGRWLRSQTEHCILATKGKPYFNNKKWTTLISEKRTTHSTKPEIFYEMVEEICAGRKLDYFARKKRKGWEVWGDEIR